MPENELSGTGLGIVITSFSNEMKRTFSWAMERRRAFIHEMDKAKNADYFISGRDKGIVISTFST